MFNISFGHSLLCLVNWAWLELLQNYKCTCTTQYNEKKLQENVWGHLERNHRNILLNRPIFCAIVFLDPPVVFLVHSNHCKSIKTLTNPSEMRNSRFLFKVNVAITQQSALLGLLHRNTTTLLTGDSGFFPSHFLSSTWWMCWVYSFTEGNSGKEFLLINYVLLGNSFLLVN